MEKISKDLLLTIIDELMAEGDFTYTAIAKKLELSKERISQLFKKFGLPNYKELRYQQELQRLRDLIDSGEVENYSLQELYLLHKSKIKKEVILEEIEKSGKKFQSKKSKFLQAVDHLNEVGFNTEEHTIKEIYNKLIELGYTSFSIMNVSNELSRYDLKFKFSLPRKNEKHDNEFVRLINSKNIDWENTSIVGVLRELNQEGLLEKIDPKFTEYKNFYPALRRYGLIPSRRTN